MKIDKLVPSDTGRYDLYLCQPADDEKSLLASIELTVKPKPISIVKRMTAKRVETNLLLLECELSQPMSNKFKMSWLKNGQPIDFASQGDQRRLVPKLANGGRTCQLFVEKFDYQDSGVYELVVWDCQMPELKESTSFKLEIKQNPFKSGMKVMNTDLSEARVLRIELETIPSDTIDASKMKWFKNEQPIDVMNSDKYKLEKIGPGKFVLEIRDVCADDNGSYQCTIEEFSNKLNLSGIENAAEPVTKQKPQAAKAQEVQETEQAVQESQIVQPEVVETQITTQTEEVAEVVEAKSAQVVEQQQVVETQQIVEENKLEQVQEQKLEEEQPTEAEVKQAETQEAKIEEAKVEQVEATTLIQEEVINEQIQQSQEAQEEKIEVVESVTEIQEEQQPVVEEKVEEPGKEETGEESKVEEIPAPQETKTEEVKVDEKLEAKEQPTEQQVEVKQPEKVDEKVEEKSVENSENKPEEKPQEQVEQKIEEKLEENPADKPTEDQVKEEPKSEDKQQEQNSTVQEVEEQKVDKIEDTEKPSDEQIVEEIVDYENHEYEVIETQEVVDAKVKPIQVVSSDWQPNTKLKEGANLTLSLGINKQIDSPDNILIYKDGQLVASTDNIIIGVKKLPVKEDQESSEIKVMITNANAANSGDYTLVFKDGEQEHKLAETSLIVEVVPKPVKILEPLKAEKTDVVESDEIRLKLKVNQPLDVAKLVWEHNKKPLKFSSQDGKLVCETAANIELIEEKTESNESIYTLVVKSAEIGKNDGEYALRIKSPVDGKEIYSGQAKISIKPRPLEITESTWQPEIKLNESQPLDLSLSINKPLKESERVVLTLNNKPSSIKPVVTTTDDGRSVIKVEIPSVKTADSGEYKLILETGDVKKPVKKELASSRLSVAEVPFEIVSPLKSSQQEFTPGQTVEIEFTCNKPLESKEKCVEWMLNGKPILIKGNVEFVQTDSEGQVTYKLSIKDAQIGKNDGEYTVKIK